MCCALHLGCFYGEISGRIPDHCYMGEKILLKFFSFLNANFSGELIAMDETPLRRVLPSGTLYLTESTECG